jgi:hypothetical protein
VCIGMHNSRRVGISDEGRCRLFIPDILSIERHMVFTPIIPGNILPYLLGMCDCQMCAAPCRSRLL